MTGSDPTASCFLVEWYQPVVLVMALTMPRDQTLFGVFCADSPHAVIQACQQAGWPADRISADVHPWLNRARY